MAKNRLFLSLNPAEEDLKELKKILPDLKNRFKDHYIKWENPDKFHLTFRFLGDIDEERTTVLASTLDRLKFDFENIGFSSDKIGYFPNSRYPNVIFAGLIEQGNNSDKLVSFIDRIILNFGVKPEKRFIPHITLGRFSRNKRKKIDEELTVSFPSENIVFDSFYLMKSTLTQDGSVYEILNKFNFIK